MRGDQYMVLVGDSETVLSAIPDNSVDSIVTDPPYHLTNEGGGPAKDSHNPYSRARAGASSKGFMGLAWDGGNVAFRPDVWLECLRVLKPGGYLLSFSAARTYHRMACAIEDAGFEIRDQIMWVYGSGFPKSMDVGKAIDRMAGAGRAGTGEVKRSGCRAARGGADLVGSVSIEAAKWKEVTVPATAAAREWDGWGTALKPAHEPICVARKAVDGTIVANVLKHGAGALNIDACRVPIDVGLDASQLRTMNRSLRDVGGGWGMSTVAGDTPQVLRADGRWPANVLHDGSPEVLDAFEAQSLGGSGTAARFFYCAKASTKDRNEGLAGKNPHPTVKPTALMSYLCKLVTPAGGIVLDPFMGSGSTGKGAVISGFRFLGIDLYPENAAVAEQRIEFALAGIARRREAA